METSAVVLPESPRHQRIAAPLHTVLLLAAQAALLFLGRVRSHAVNPAEAPNHIALYGRTMVVEWLLFAFVVVGVWRAGAPLETVLGKRWSSLRQFLKELGIAVLFLMASIMLESIVSGHAHGGDHNATVQAMLPHGATDLALWIALSLTAGICEEAIYRGYLQRQFMALTQSVPAGIVFSAVLFGAAHAYQGLQQALQIGLLGVMGGILAHWWGSVRPGMMAHTLQDVLGGLVKH
ncbi:MAG: CPBP family intramembrane metalloprotease [Acidobacteriia bacterium]|nr:CPBP family intramembrane metalloprotease [Terriglobia bacterium]